VAASTATFRAAFPEFIDTTEYPETVITYWFGIAGLLLNSTSGRGFRDMLDHATYLFAAHNIVLERQARKARSGVGPAGPVTSKSVGPGSISYDASAGLVKDAGHWNLTNYGTRLIELIDMFGAGGIQL
jgi:hypothetical protein